MGLIDSVRDFFSGNFNAAPASGETIFGEWVITELTEDHAIWHQDHYDDIMLGDALARQAMSESE